MKTKNGAEITEFSQFRLNNISVELLEGDQEKCAEVFVKMGVIPSKEWGGFKEGDKWFRFYKIGNMVCYGTFKFVPRSTEDSITSTQFLEEYGEA